MIEKLKGKIDMCEPMSAVFIAQISEFIEDSYNHKEISQDTFSELRNRLRSAAHQFPLNCLCNCRKISGLK